MMECREQFSPVVNQRFEENVTGRLHEWCHNEGPYYGPAWICRSCGRKSWGWNLWKEDYLPTCTGNERVECLLEALREIDKAYNAYLQGAITVQDYEQRTNDAEAIFFKQVGIADSNKGRLLDRVTWYRDSAKIPPDVKGILEMWDW
jgi:hypothetical protein